MFRLPNLIVDIN